MELSYMTEHTLLYGSYSHAKSTLTKRDTKGLQKIDSKIKIVDIDLDIGKSELLADHLIKSQ